MKARSFLTLATPLAIGMLLLAGCGSDSSSTSPTTAPTGRGLTLSAADDKYAPRLLEVSAGKTVKVQITNISTPHTLTISPWSINVAITKNGTQEIEFAVPANATGEVPFFCSLHVDMGGTVRVR